MKLKCMEGKGCAIIGAISRIWDFICRWRWVSAGFLILGILFIAPPIFDFFDIKFLGFGSLKFDSDHGLVALSGASLIILNCLLVIVTALIVCVAWVQLSGIKRVGRGDFLLRIDERFGDKSIIDARIILNKIYRHTKPVCVHSASQKRRELCSDCEEKHFINIRDSIKDLGRDAERSRKHMLLRNLLDLHETVGHFANRNYVDPKDVDSLMGGTVSFHYRVFRDWIKYIQEPDDDSYIEFEMLVYGMNKDLVDKERWPKLDEKIASRLGSENF